MAWSFGKRLQHVRIERGISQQDLAAHAQIRQSHLSMLERALHYPNASIVRRLVHALRVNPDYLLGLSNTCYEVHYAPLEEEEPRHPRAVAP
jgi:transcriptional regulator with XRE-family HTH domain